MRKKILALTVAAVLLVIASISGTYAYLKDTDGAKNVMVAGNVTIAQYEKDSAGNAFANGQKLLPAKYTSTPTTDANGLLTGIENELDKFVTVENTGTESAFIRTIFLFEKDGGNDNIDMIHYTCEQELVWTGLTVNINGVDYYVAIATYPTAFEAGETTAPSLKQIYLDSSAGNEWFTAIDGAYDIYVFSQAVQANGFNGNVDEAFDTAFGAVTAENVIAWFNTVNFQ